MVSDTPPPAAESAPEPLKVEFVIGGERLAGAYAFSDVVSDDQPATRTEDSGGVVNLLMGSSLSVGGFNPFIMPRTKPFTTSGSFLMESRRILMVE